MKGMRNIAPFGLRMPDDLREAIAKRAKNNGRSMNSEIVQILQDAIDSEGFIKGIEEFEKHQNKIKKIDDDSERERYIANIENKDPFTAEILKEIDSHNRKLVKILSMHLEGDAISKKKPT